MLAYRPMMQSYPSSALEEELAYRREILMATARDGRTRRGAWFRNARRPR
jgi:hypothetical protein